MVIRMMRWTASSLVLALGLGCAGPAVAASTQQGGLPDAGLKAVVIHRLGDAAAKPIEHPRLHKGRDGEKQPHGQNREAAEHRAYSDAAAVLGLTVEELQEQLKSGKSLADIAASKGISKKKLISGLTAKTSARLDEAVKSGKLTADTATRLQEKLADKWTERVDVKGLAFAPNPKGPHREHRQMMAGQFTRIAAIIGISKDELEKRLAEGKSLAEIALAEGISRETLIARIKEDLTPVLEKMIDAKRPAKPNPASVPKS